MICYRDFLDADERRRGDALEFGHDWRGPEGRYRVCWYQHTGELTAERLSETQPLALEDFHRRRRGARPGYWLDPVARPAQPAAGRLAADHARAASHDRTAARARR